MENPISISNLNDFVFCPVSIYFHNLYDGMDNMTYQSNRQISGTIAHDGIDSGTYSTNRSILQGISVYCDKYNLIGKIDLYDKKTKTLTERKKKVSKIYDGYVFQVYAQFFSLLEMGYDVEHIVIHSLDDNRNYDIPLPEYDAVMFSKFEKTIHGLETFVPESFVQNNKEKCMNCIYEPYCDRGMPDDF